MGQAEEKRYPLREFLKKRGVLLSPKAYFVDAMSAMALGLFASLLMGTIFGTVADNIVAKLMGTENAVYELFALVKQYGSAASGAVIGIAVAYSLKAPPLVLFSAGAIGMLGNAYGTEVIINGAVKSASAGPLGAFICVLVAAEVGKLVSKTTKVDILVTPAVTLGVGTLTALLLCPAAAWGMYWLGYFIDYATGLYPLFMGIIISVVVGVVLTLPISSAALCAMINIGGIAGGAAAVGCCAQMVGFAVISFRENRWGGVVAQGLGTSMLQMGNIVKNPKIWIPPTLAAAITGPLATCLFKLECSGVSAGMGTCGMVGPIGIIADMGFTAQSGLGILVLCIVAPAVLSLVFSELLRLIGWISPDDMKLEL